MSIFSLKPGSEYSYQTTLNISRTVPLVTVRINNGVGETVEVRSARSV